MIADNCGVGRNNEDVQNEMLNEPLVAETLKKSTKGTQASWTALGDGSTAMGSVLAVEEPLVSAG